MRGARTWLLLALAAGAAILWKQSRTPGGAAVVSDALESVIVTAQKVGSALLPRGIRNHNPGNIRYLPPDRAWNGQIANDNGYGVYQTAALGVRALGRQLRAYEARGLNTVAGIISTWAPSSENNTAAYVAAVSRALGVQPGEPFRVGQMLPALAAAIIKHENGFNPYSAADVAEWVNT